MGFEIDTIPLVAVRIHKDTQSRVTMDKATIDEYAEAIRQGAKFPPVVTFFDGEFFWLADGFHRYFAHKAAGEIDIASEQRDGTHRDAILHSCGANAAHGLRRTNGDKRRAVQTLLDDPEWVAWSDREIARKCSVGADMVGGLRKSYLPETTDTPAPTVRTVERNGKTYKQNTAQIGKSKPTDDAPGGAETAPAPVAVLNPSPVAAPEAAPAELEPAPDVPDQVAPDEVQALREQLAEEIERNTELAASMKETLADNEMMGRAFDADDRIAASMAEAKRQSALADVAEIQFRGQQGKLVAMTKAVTLWKGRAERAEKKLKKLEAAK